MRGIPGSSHDTSKRRSRAVLAIGLAALVASGAAALVGASTASAYSQDYCGVNVQVSPGNNCAAVGYHSIIYNRATDFFYTNNACVGMVTEAGNLRGGTIRCAAGGSDTGAICVSSATPTSQGRATPANNTTFFSAVENNTTYYSGCAV